MEDQSSYKENQLYCYSAKKNELGEDLENNPNQSKQTVKLLDSRSRQLVQIHPVHN